MKVVKKRFLSLTRKPRPWDVGEIVVLVMVAHVEGHHVERAVVRVRLETFLEHVVLRDKVSGHRMKAHGHEGAREQVEEDFAAEIGVDEIVEGKLDHSVEVFEFQGLLRVSEERPEGVEERLEADPDPLCERVAKQFGLERRGYISVDDVLSLILDKKN